MLLFNCHRSPPNNSISLARSFAFVTNVHIFSLLLQLRFRAHFFLRRLRNETQNAVFTQPAKNAEMNFDRRFSSRDFNERESEGKFLPSGSL